MQHRSIQRLIEIKQRNLDKGLVLLANRLKLFTPLIDKNISPELLERITQPQVRPTTWLLPASSDCPKWLTGGKSTIAIRLCDLPHVAVICDRIGFPLVSTSANISGRPHARGDYQIRRLFGSKLDFIIHAEASRQAIASRIIDALSGKIIRP
jgi:L-threonylcarbamoyladenylate synthase